ncbi:MAG: hypothetical protein AB8B94_09615 [Hyphomicrobiales bacterium]
MLRHAWTLFLCLLMVGGAAVTYQIKYKAELAASDANRLAGEIDGLEEDLSRLKAQWSLLNQPSRLQALVESNADVLPLFPLSPHQVAFISEVPEKSPLSLVLPPRKPFLESFTGNDLATLIDASSEPSLADLISREIQ